VARDAARLLQQGGEDVQGLDLRVARGARPADGVGEGLLRAGGELQVHRYLQANGVDDDTGVNDARVELVPLNSRRRHTRPAPLRRGAAVGIQVPMDITELILFQHHEQRRTFALLDEVPRDDTTALAAIWNRLEVLLEVHAAAEEEFFYPRLLAVGHGAADADSVAEETQDAVKDHNEIRDAVRRVSGHEPGSDAWWEGVEQARIANSDHMAEEERQDLADFRRHADLQTRHDIAVQFIAYENEHAYGIPARDRDPEAYVRDHS